MTNEKAMEVLIRARKIISPVGPLHEALGLAIKMMKAASTDRNVDDTISRNEAIEAIEFELDSIDHVPQWVFDRLTNRLRQLPPVEKQLKGSKMDELISKQEVVDLLKGRASYLRGIPGDLGGACSGAAKLIMQMPPAEPEFIKCDYVKACNEVTMNKTFSAWRYLDMLDDFEEYGYVLVKKRG